MHVKTIQKRIRRTKKKLVYNWKKGKLELILRCRTRGVKMSLLLIQKMCLNSGMSVGDQKVKRSKKESTKAVKERNCRVAEDEMAERCP